MAAKAIVDSLDGLPEAVKAAAEKLESGAFVVPLDALLEAHGKLGEFRDNNINLAKERERLQSQLAGFKDVDPTKYREMQQRIQDLDDKKLIDAGKIDELVAQRVERYKADAEARIADLDKANKAAATEVESTRSQLAELLIDSQVKEIAVAQGAKAKALPHIVRMARERWKLDNGEARAFEDLKGEKPMFSAKKPGVQLAGKDGLEEWLGGIKKEDAFLFESPAGGGAPGGASVGGNGNGTFRLTPEQARNVDTYRAAKAQAEKAGATLEIVE